MAMMVIAPGGLLRMAGTDGEGRALGALRQLEEQKRVAKAKAQEEEKDRAEGKAEEEEVVVAAQNVELPILASYSVAFDDVPLTDEQQEWVDVILTRLARCIAVSLRKSEPILPIFKKQKWMKVVRTPVWLLSLLAQKHCARALDRGVCMDGCTREHACILCVLTRPDEMRKDADGGDHMPLKVGITAGVFQGVAHDYVCPVARALARDGTLLDFHFQVLRRALPFVHGIDGMDTHDWFSSEAARGDVLPATFRIP